MTTYTLVLILLRQSSIFPQDTAHWGLLLREDDQSEGTFFHASKQSLDGETRYRQIHSYEPGLSTSLVRAITVASGLALDPYTLDQFCRATATDRPFDLLVNNCQAFCTEILVKLRDNGYISVDDFDSLRQKGFTPIIVQSTQRV